MLKRCDDSYEAECSQLLLRHLRSCVYTLVLTYAIIVRMMSTYGTQTCLVRLVEMFLSILCQLEHLITERRSDVCRPPFYFKLH